MSLEDSWFSRQPHLTPRFWRLKTKLMCALVQGLSKVVMGYMQRTKIHHRDRFLDILESNYRQRGLVTVSNHESRIDDPALWCMLKWRHVLTKSDMIRWAPGAEDIVFRDEFPLMLRRCFYLGKVMPIVRGQGVYQMCTDFLVEQLDKGKWVHMFPEGKINMEQANIRHKWGTGRLIVDANPTPIVLPIALLGMENILPNTGPIIPRFMKKITIVVGTPLDFRKDLEMFRDIKTPTEMRKHISDVIQLTLRDLKQKAEAIHNDR